MRGAGRLCRERPKSLLAPREGSALSNLFHNDQMRRGGSRTGLDPSSPPLHVSAREERQHPWALAAGQLSMKQEFYSIGNG